MAPTTALPAINPLIMTLPTSNPMTTMTTTSNPMTMVLLTREDPTTMKTTMMSNLTTTALLMRNLTTSDPKTRAPPTSNLIVLSPTVEADNRVVHITPKVPANKQSKDHGTINNQGLVDKQSEAVANVCKAHITPKVPAQAIRWPRQPQRPIIEQSEAVADVREAHILLDVPADKQSDNHGTSDDWGPQQAIRSRHQRPRGPHCTWWTCQPCPLQRGQCHW